MVEGEEKRGKGINGISAAKLKRSMPCILPIYTAGGDNADNLEMCSGI